MIVVIIALVMFLKPVFPVLDYLVNYDYVSTVLCENKDKPKMHCNGKCHLMKELAKEAESEKPISNDKKDNSKQETEVLFYQDIKSLELSQIYFQDKTSVYNDYSYLYFHKNDSSVFHPPALYS